MQPECRQHPTAQPEGLSKDYSARYSRGMLSLSNYGPYKPCNPWHLSAGLVMLRCCEEISSNQDSAFTSEVALAALEVAAVGDPSSQWMARGWKVHGKGNGSEIQESKSIRAG